MYIDSGALGVFEKGDYDIFLRLFIIQERVGTRVSFFLPNSRVNCRQHFCCSCVEDLEFVTRKKLFRLIVGRCSFVP